MPAFDEILELEDRQQSLELELGKARDFVRSAGRKHLDARADLQRVERHIETLAAMIRHMKYEAPVVLLSEYEHAQNTLEDNRALLGEKNLEISRLVKELKLAGERIKMLEASLMRVAYDLESYNRVVQFRR